MNCARFHQLLEAHLVEDLPEEAGSHAEGCEACAGELEAQRLLGRVLLAFGRPEMPPGFFARQQAGIMERVRTEVTRQAEVAWKAPAGSLVLMLGVVAAYAFLGVEGCLDGFLGGPETTLGGTDPLNSVSLVYVALVALGLWVVGRDTAGGSVHEQSVRG